MRILSRKSKVLGALTETSVVNMKKPFEARHNAIKVGDSYGKGAKMAYTSSCSIIGQTIKSTKYLHLCQENHVSLQHKKEAN